MKAATTAVLISACVMSFGSASAAPIPCDVVSDTVNYMEIDSSQVVACLDAGSGNLNGNPASDLFLTGVGSGLGYELIGKSDDDVVLWDILVTQAGSSGTWSFDPALWDLYSDLVIGFKFGTGNQDDEWFVYSVQYLVSSGDWDFFNMGGTGGGMSHFNVYGVPVPEPATIALLGIGLLLIAFRRRYRPHGGLLQSVRQTQIRRSR